MRVDDPGLVRQGVDGACAPYEACESYFGLGSILTAARGGADGGVEFGEKPINFVSFLQIDDQARRLAGGLARLHAPGERVLIGFGSSAEFFSAFFGCLYAGLVPAPAPQPTGSRRARRLKDMVAASGASRILADDGAREAASELGLAFAPLSELYSVAPVEPLKAAPGDVAYLQFTSGSTAASRGVMISHGAALANIEALFECAGRPDGPCVSWLPLSHDMGLVTALAAISRGHRIALIDPQQFARRPWIWLETISRGRAQYSGAPNFAYDLLARASAPPEAEALDLSCWKFAFVGAETIKRSTMRRFARRFAAAGFDAAAATPAYGLAECTLLATSGGPGEGARFVEIPAQAAGGRMRPVCDVGAPIKGHRLLIVNPGDFSLVPEGEVGEAWFDGPGKGLGYWGRPQETEATFKARIPGQSGEFLRTGDLGFMRDGRFHVVGRIKETLIVRGRNVHPEEIETVAMSSHPALSGAAAAYALDDGDGFGLLCEMRSSEFRNRSGEVIAAIQTELAQTLGVTAARVSLTRQGSAPRTTSGKVQRFACAEALDSNNVKLYADWRSAGKLAPGAAPRKPGAADIREFIVRFIEARAGVDCDLVANGGALSDAGLDSMGTIELGFALEDWLNISLDVSVIWRFSTIDEFAVFLEKLAKTSAMSPPARLQAAPVAGGVGPRRGEMEAQPLNSDV